MRGRLVRALVMACCATLVGACAELRVREMTHAPTAPNTRDPVTFTAVVVNDGWRRAEASQLSFRVGGESAPPLYPVPRLAPGESFTVTRTVTLGVAQNYRNTAVADATHAVREGNEGNNSATHDYTVVPWTLDAWLASHPRIAAAIAWEQPSSIPNDMLAYPAWTPAMKADLASAFAGVRRGSPAGLPPIPDTDLTISTSNDVWAVQVQQDLAWQYYVAYTAQALAAEIGVWFPWSVESYGDAALGWLFDSRVLFSWGTGPQRYMILKLHAILVSQGMATPSDPGTTLKLVEDLGLVGATPAATSENLFTWSRDNLKHFYGSETAANNLAHWGFRGFPPVERILQGTYRQAGGGTSEFGHWTAGCWGTTALTRLLGKVLNIPVGLEKVRSVGGLHATPYFMAQDQYWSHGDDPYNALARELNPATPAIAPARYFLNHQTYRSWFGSSVTDAASGSNIGRRVAELAVSELADYLLKQRCIDRAQGAANAAGQVYALLSAFYSLNELDALKLWANLDQRIAALGGCGAIP